MKKLKTCLLIIPVLVTLFLSAFHPYPTGKSVLKTDLCISPIFLQIPEDVDWQQIMGTAFQSVGITDFSIFPDSSELEAHAMGFSNESESEKIWFVIYTPENPGYDLLYSPASGGDRIDFADIVFHGLPGKEFSSYAWNGNPINNGIIYDWNGFRIVIYRFCYDVCEFSKVYRYADALYFASMGGANSPTPTTFNDKCANVACPEDYCSPDGTTLLHDCSCSPADGQCNCEQTACPTGCDSGTNACRPEACNNVICTDKCEDNISYKTGTCDPLNGECVYEETVDCGLAGCDLATNLCKTQNDLSITKVTLLQAVEGGILVDRKPTAVIVALEWPDPNSNVETGVTLFIDGVPFQTQQHNTKLVYSQSEMSRNQDKVVFHIPTGYMTSGNHQFQVEAVLLDAQMVDMNLSNNSYSSTENFTLSRSITLLYAAQSGVPQTQVYNFHNTARAFLLNILPVTNVNMASTFFTLDENESAKNQVALLEELRSLYNTQAGQFARFAVGLYPDGKFGEEVNGFSYFWARRSVMVGDGSSNPFAHEALPHEMGHELFGDEYSSSSIGVSLPNNIYTYDGQRKYLQNLAYVPGGMVNFMGNAGTVSNLWVNKDTWDALVGLFGIGTSYTPEMNKLALQIQEEQTTTSGYLVSGYITTDDRVTIRNLIPFESLPVEAMYERDYWIEVVGLDGSTVDQYPLEVDFSEGDTKAFFIRNVPAVIENTQGLQILHNEEVIWRSAASNAAPQVSISTPVGNNPLSGKVELSWLGQDNDSPVLTYTLLYSHDNGSSWVPLAANLSDTTYMLDLDNLPGGTDCLLKVIASDGWNATTSQTATTFSVTDKPATLVIVSPKIGSSFVPGDQIDLNAYVVDLETGWVDDNSILWHSSIDGQLGSGSIFGTTSLSAGTHEITAIVINPDGTQMQKSIKITVTDSGLQSERNLKIIRTGIQTEIALVLFILGIMLLVIFVRKHKTVLVVLTIIEVFCAAIFLGYSSILFAISIKAEETNTQSTNTAETVQVVQPSLQIPTDNLVVPTEVVLTEAVPTEVTASETVESEGFTAEYKNILLRSTVGDNFTFETIPSDTEPDSFFGLPSHDQFTISGYPVQNNLFDPVVRVFSAFEYESSSEEAQTIIDDLRQLLADRPNNLPQQLPFLPEMPCGSLGFAKYRYLDFETGSGIRYITQCAQNTWPLANNLLFYTFQGITTDGKFYISMIMPLSHGSLEEYDNFEPPDDFNETGVQLITGQFIELENSVEESFTPSMVDLDDLVRSMTVYSN